MGLTALHTLLCFLTTFTLTTQELAKLSVSPPITAECGKQVTLNCNVSSSRNELSIRHMAWSRDTTSLCSVDSEGNVKKHDRQSLSGFRCEYKHGELSLIFDQVQPLEIGKYRCKLQSNHGLPHEYTTVELQECSGIVDNFSTSDGLVHMCTFNRVYPDGDVHWFHGSHSLSDWSPHNTSKQVDKRGWLTIHSYLNRKSSDVPYNCSLMSTKSGRYIVSALVQTPEFPDTHPFRSGVGSHGPMTTFLCISTLLAVIIK